MGVRQRIIFCTVDISGLFENLVLNCGGPLKRCYPMETSQGLFIAQNIVSETEIFPMKLTQTSLPAGKEKLNSNTDNKELSTPQCTDISEEDIVLPCGEQSVVENPPDPEVFAAVERLHGQRSVYRLLKRFIDVLFSLLVLICFCWLYALIALAIKLEDPRSPVIYSQNRISSLYGKGEIKQFRMYKFRSMIPNAEEHLKDLLKENEKSGPVFKIKDDPRMTRVGRIIRKLSLDELPQFVNVLRGDMAIVGPRPALPREVVKYTERQKQRLLVKPGITCYWQTTPHRDRISFDDWVDLDLKYIKECNILTDIKLVFKTLSVVFTGQGN